MNDDDMNPATKLAHLGRPAPEHWPAAVNVQPHRASTITFPDIASYRAVFTAAYGTLGYGRDGSPTIHALEGAVAALDGAEAALAMPSGMAAIACALVASLRGGDHVLLPDSMYGTARTFCQNQLPRMGIEFDFYPPADVQALAAKLRPNTKVVYSESPGSVTMEIQDIPAIVSAAHAHGAIVVMDNTWATPLLFPASRFGVDISIHAATKYIVGHSDAMLGLVLCRQACLPGLRTAMADFGYVAGSEETYLALRGLRTLGIRLKQHEANAMHVARHLRERPEIAQVLYPALPGSAGHELWKRDFSGASGLLGAVVADAFEDRVDGFIDALRLFSIGASWGGYESLVTEHRPAKRRTLRDWRGKHILRFHVGLEDADDLVRDLNQAFGVAAAKPSNALPDRKSGSRPHIRS